MLYLPASGHSPRNGTWGSEFLEGRVKPRLLRASGAQLLMCLHTEWVYHQYSVLFGSSPLSTQMSGWTWLVHQLVWLIITSGISEWVFFQPLFKKILTKDWILATEKLDSLVLAVSQFSKHLQHMREPMGQVGGWSHVQAQWCWGGSQCHLQAVVQTADFSPVAGDVYNHGECRCGGAQLFTYFHIRLSNIFL